MITERHLRISFLSLKQENEKKGRKNRKRERKMKTNACRGICRIKGAQLSTFNDENFDVYLWSWTLETEWEWEEDARISSLKTPPPLARPIAVARERCILHRFAGRRYLCPCIVSSSTRVKRKHHFSSTARTSILLFLFSVLLSCFSFCFFFLFVTCHGLGEHRLKNESKR